MTQPIIFCSVCKTPERDPSNPDSVGVDKLVQLNDLKVWSGGQTVQAEGHICDQCVQLMAEILEFNVQASSSDQLALEGLPSARAILERLDEHVMGQEVAKKIIATAAASHLRASLHNKSAGPDEKIGKSNILIYGPTGTGKTFIVNMLARILGKDLSKHNAPDYTAAGYVGKSVEGMIQDLFNACENDVERTENGIIFIDEVDKIAVSRGGAGGKDVNGRAVQQALLTMLEGEVVEVEMPGGNPMAPPKKVPIDTSGILFVCAGSFAGIEKIVEKRLGTDNTPIGFGASSDEAVEKVNYHAEITKEDLFAFGIIPEMIGRLPSRGHLDALDVETLRRIMTNPPNSHYKQRQRLFEISGSSLTFDDEALTAVAKFAQSQGTGARELNGVINHIILEYEFDLDPEAEDSKDIVITEEIVKEKLKTYTSGKVDSEE